MSVAFAKEIYAAVNADFAQRREAALGLQSQRKEELYRLFPRLEEIERLLALTSMELISQVASGSNVKGTILKVMNKNRELQAERQEILQENGYDTHYLDVAFLCRECADTGFIGSRMCSCYEEALRQAAYNHSVLATAMPEARFENFHLNYYSCEPDATGISPKERMEFVWNSCRTFCQEFDSQKKSLLFYGPTGLGKTFLSGCISRELTDRGKIVVYDTAYSIFSLLEKEKFYRDGSETDTSYLFECDLLIIDDLGTEMQTSFTKSAFYNLVNTRLLKNKLTLINTNCTMKELEQTYTPRIMSRLLGEYTLMRFAGEDIRQLIGLRMRNG
jgi:DNA replication protein DnaC